MGVGLGVSVHKSLCVYVMCVLLFFLSSNSLFSVVDHLHHFTPTSQHPIRPTGAFARSILMLPLWYCVEVTLGGAFFSFTHS